MKFCPIWSRWFYLSRSWQHWRQPTHRHSRPHRRLVNSNFKNDQAFYGSSREHSIKWFKHRDRPISMDLSPKSSKTICTSTKATFQCSTRGTLPPSELFKIMELKMQIRQCLIEADALFRRNEFERANIQYIKCLQLAREALSFHRDSNTARNQYYITLFDTNDETVNYI